MDFVDNAGTRYQLTETAETPTPTKKAPVWPWVVGGLAVAGGLAWMASQISRKTNPVDSQVEALIAEARDPNTPYKRLEKLANSHEEEVALAILDNPNVCPFNKDGSLNTLLLVALAEQFPDAVAAHSLFALRALVEHEDEMADVVIEVVERTKDTKLIESLLSAWGPSEWAVRGAVARNRNTPPDLLRILGTKATESKAPVRRLVASNPNTPLDVLRNLGNEKNESHQIVREAVASNPSTPEDVLRTLANPATESDADVRQAAQSAL